MKSNDAFTKCPSSLCNLLDQGFSSRPLVSRKPIWEGGTCGRDIVTYFKGRISKASGTFDPGENLPRPVFESSRRVVELD